MELIISGYGEEGRKNIIKCDEKGNETWSDTIESPSFVCVKGDLMFAGTESDKYSVIHAYKSAGNGYKLTDSVKFDEGTCLCHICYSPKNRMVFGACWGSGHLLYAILDENGKFTKHGSIYQKNETGDDEIISRVHFVHICKDETKLIATNVGTDVIYFYDIKDSSVSECDRIYTQKGQHPRHAVFSSNEKTLYVITELSNEILVYEMPKKKLKQRISTLPAGYVGKSHCSAICLSPDGKTLYGANRYSESIVFFSVDSDGILKEKHRINCSGERPRHMMLSKSGKYLMICYQISGELCIIPLGEDGLPLDGKSYSFPFHDAAGIAEL